MLYPVDTTNLVFRVAVPPRPDTDYETGQQKTNRDGEPLAVVQVFAIDGTEAELIRVRVPQAAVGASVPDHPVAPVGLKCRPWSRGDRGGTSFSADRLDPVTPPAPAASSGSSSAKGGDK